MVAGSMIAAMTGEIRRVTKSVARRLHNKRAQAVLQTRRGCLSPKLTLLLACLLYHTPSMELVARTVTLHLDTYSI